MYLSGLDEDSYLSARKQGLVVFKRGEIPDSRLYKALAPRWRVPGLRVPVLQACACRLRPSGPRHAGRSERLTPFYSLGGERDLTEHVHGNEAVLGRDEGFGVQGDGHCSRRTVLIPPSPTISRFPHLSPHKERSPACDRAHPTPWPSSARGWLERCEQRQLGCGDTPGPSEPRWPLRSDSGAWIPVLSGMESFF